jgi:hypothetical protein
MNFHTIIEASGKIIHNIWEVIFRFFHLLSDCNVFFQYSALFSYTETSIEPCFNAITLVGMHVPFVQCSYVDFDLNGFALNQNVPHKMCQIAIVTKVRRAPRE